MKITIYLDVARYPHLLLSVEKALVFLDKIAQRRGSTLDVEETKRVVSNFEVYYEMSWRKSDGYITIPKNPADAVYGKIVVHKIRLITRGDEKIVELIIDRRVPRQLLEGILRELGYSEIEYVERD